MVSHMEGMDKLVITLDLQDPSLRHVLDLKEVIADVLQLPASKLILHDIGPGSVVVTFWVATSLGEKSLLESPGTAKPLTQEQKDKLLEANVASLKFKEITVFKIFKGNSSVNALTGAIHSSMYCTIGSSC